jgi:hypothetical protein
MTLLMRLSSNILRENFSKYSNEIINLYAETREQPRTQELCFGRFVDCIINV